MRKIHFRLATRGRSIQMGPCMDGCAGRPAEGRRCKSVTVKAQRATPTPSHARAVVRLQAKR